MDMPFMPAGLTSVSQVNREWRVADQQLFQPYGQLADALAGFTADRSIGCAQLFADRYSKSRSVPLKPIRNC
jgi:hypothetical protein